MPGGCLLWVGGVCSWGGCLFPGRSARGRGCLLPGRCGIPACTEADIPPLTESQMPVKTLPWPNFVAAGNNKKVFQPKANRLLSESSVEKGWALYRVPVNMFKHVLGEKGQGWGGGGLMSVVVTWGPRFFLALNWQNDWLMDRHDWKHYLSVTSSVDSTNLFGQRSV